MSEQHWVEVRDQNLEERFSDKKIKGLTFGQNRYIEAISRDTIILCLGPAGSGKTFIAIAKAIEALKAGKIKKIVLTRPMITCGQGLGFLPGDVEEKFAPYLRPMLDAMDAFLSPHEQERMLDEGFIELIPLELLRGASCKDSYIILDEAQNCSYDQLLMLLTRFGTNCKIIVCGDHRQSDLELDETVPLVQIFNNLGGIKEIGRIQLKKDDIVRHPLIKKILERLD